jgi:hypothetical protein
MNQVTALLDQIEEAGRDKHAQTDNTLNSLSKHAELLLSPITSPGTDPDRSPTPVSPYPA